MTYYLAGQKFNRLSVIEKVVAHNKSSSFWKCKCDCGSIIEVSGAHLRSGHTKSCGCFIKDNPPTITHGYSRNKNRTYKTWLEMRQRCNNPKSDKHQWYGGRGITICERWNNFVVFLEDMGERPEKMTLDRINNDGNYEPSNCRWATQKEQIRNSSWPKLNQGAAEEIRRLRDAGMKIRELATLYGISNVSVYNVVKMRSWC